MDEYCQCVNSFCGAAVGKGQNGIDEAKFFTRLEQTVAEDWKELIFEDQEFRTKAPANPIIKT